MRLHLHSIIPPKPFFRLFTRPFRRKSVPSSPALPPKTFRSSSEGPVDSVKIIRTLRKKRIRVLKRRLRKRVDVYVHCRVERKSVFKKKSRNIVDSNSVVSAANRIKPAWHGCMIRSPYVCLFLGQDKLCKPNTSAITDC